MKRFSGMRKSSLTIAGLTTGSLIYLLLAFNQPSWGRDRASSGFGHGLGEAQSSRLKDYQPPAGTEPPRRTRGGGTRGGCDSQAAIDTTALAPQTHIGQTASTRPTLVWFVADETPYPVEVQLYRYVSSDSADDRLEPVGTFDLGLSQVGWMTLTLPATLPPLVVGETYRWKVIVKCSAGQPSKNSLDEADLQVVAAPAAMPATGDPVQQADQYVAMGLWYDAIAVLSQAPVSPAAAAYRSELVASLAELEVENPNDEFSLFSDRLIYIADWP
jgi:hypothetical protein